MNRDFRPAQLQRKFALWDAVAIYIGIILGSGIFVAPGLVALAAPNFAWAAGFWLVGGVIALCGALCYAECGARIPLTGGFYIFYRRVFGDGIAFVAGCVASTVTYPAAIAGIAMLFATYARSIWPDLSQQLAAMVAIVSCGVLHAAGIRSGAWTQRILTATKVGALLFVAVAAWVAGSAPTQTHLSSDTLGVGAAAALIMVLWTYDGWSDVTLISGELKDPARNLGRTVFLGTFILAGLYVVVQYAVWTLLTPESVRGSEQVFATTVEQALGAGAWVAMLILVSTLGSINGIVLTGSRVVYAMAVDRLMPHVLAQVNGRSQTPLLSLAWIVVVSCVFVSLADFQGLVALFTFAVWLFYGLTAVALLLLRARRVGEPLAWRAPGGVAVPFLTIGVAVAMTIHTAYEAPLRAVMGAGVLVLLFLGRVLWSSRKRNRVSPGDSE